MNPTIGIIIPAFIPSEQHILFLDKCIESVKKQKYKNLFTVIVYNGPNRKNYNNCISVDLSYKTSAAVARNIGASILNNCEYFCFLDADDMFAADKVEKQVQVMIDENIDFCFTEPVNINIDGTQRDEAYIYKDISSHDEIKSMLPKINMLPLSSSMIKSSSFFSCGMFPASIEYQIQHHYGHLNSKNATYEDYLLWVSAISKNYVFKKLKDQLTYCRVGSTVER